MKNRLFLTLFLFAPMLGMDEEKSKPKPDNFEQYVILDKFTYKKMVYQLNKNFSQVFSVDEADRFIDTSEDPLLPEDEQFQDVYKEAVCATKYMNDAWLAVLNKKRERVYEKLTKKGINLPAQGKKETLEEYRDRFLSSNEKKFKDPNSRQYFKRMLMILYTHIQQQRDEIKALCPRLKDDFDPNIEYGKKHGGSAFFFE